MSRNWIVAGVATVCFITGVVLSHRIEPGVRVEKVTLAEDTPAPLNSPRAGNKRFIYRQKDDPNARNRRDPQG